MNRREIDGGLVVVTWMFAMIFLLLFAATVKVLITGKYNSTQGAVERIR